MSRAHQQALSENHAKRFPGLDGLRALAALTVFWGHAPLRHFINGGVGVTVFFFLSGFLITTLMRREIEKVGRLDFVGFYLRRTLRIVPPMLTAIALALVLIILGVLDDRVSGMGLVACVFFFNNYYLIVKPGATELINSIPLWSLCVEEHFYLVFPILLAGARRVLKSLRRQAFFLIGLCLFIQAWAILLLWQGAAGMRLYLGSDIQSQTILYGCVMALIWNPLYGETPVLLLRGLHYWPVALLLFWLAGQYGQAAVFGVLRGPFQGACLLVIFSVVLSRRSRVLSALLDSRPLIAMGGVSYSFYLVHVIVIESVESALPGSSDWLLTLTALFLTCAVAWLMKWGIETPSLNLRKKIEQTRPSTAVTERPTAVAAQS